MSDMFNVATRFVDRNVVEGRGEKTAIECGEQRITYRELLENTNRVGNALRRLGVQREERVDILLPDSPEFLYCFYGAIKIGAVAVPLNTLLKPADYEFLFNHSEARVAIVHESLAAQALAHPRERLRSLETIVIAGGNGEGVRLDGLMNAADAALDPAPTSRDDAAFWLYSSGSTGKPKACVHLHHDMVVCSESYAVGVLKMTGADRCYSVARLFFAYGLGNAGYFPLYAGATTILNPARPTVESIFADIERYRPTLFFSVPTNYAALLAHRREGGGEFDLSSIRHAVSAGESLPAPLFERFKERFGVEILDAWGSTETLHMALSNRPGEARPGSSGKPIPGVEAKLLDEEDRRVAPGDVGNLFVKSDATCSCYWNEPEKSKKTFLGEWFRTGDKYYQDEDGYFWYAGRADDLFKVNGKWVSPAEVESALIAHPAVQEAAVVARDDANGLTKPAAYVVLADEARAGESLARELQESVAKAIGGYKRPQWIEFVRELPKTATGKLQRYRLRERQKTAIGHE